ncbi:MAG: hypothetical protein COS35_09465 [Zetaproteobacteria bacterium CG02_land_8_20_14_3_00_50_9]|nr:MAG: hypothetical protein COW62_10435 [Zetaproteobacteria bacterium CG17_big_fil_post_rev_8_21_14_2_50_50_13]PIV29916.1 MAG: hypothetical protein COS35_09465 [Zetaproteobacteria bacterium CG02_land_8_20_14_3_00_50_9]
MKLIIKIAAGIILSSVLITGLWFAFAAYQMKQVQIQTEKVQEASQQKALEQLRIDAEIQRMNAEKQRQQQIILQKQMLEKQQQVELPKQKPVEPRKVEEVKQRQLQINQYQERKNKSAAWDKYYKKPYLCNNATTTKDKDWCWQHLVKAKDKFNDLWAKGLLHKK